MQKHYSLKLYTLSGVYLSTVSPRLIMSSPSFSSTTEGWQGELSLQLAVSGDYTGLAYGTIVRLVCVDDSHPLGRQIYSGYVTQIKRIFNETEYYEVRIVGLASVLSFAVYPNGTYTGTPWALIAWVLDSFAIAYPWLITYTPASIDTSGASVTVSFANYVSCLEAIRTIAKTAQNLWSVDSLGVFNFRGTGDYSSHILTLGREVQELEIEESAEEIANSITVQYQSGGIGFYAWVTVEDTASIAQNGKRQKYIIANEISTAPNATIRGQAELEKYKTPKQRIQATVNTLYDLESLQAGDRVTVRNSKIAIDALQIRRISYTEKEVKIDLEETRSFAESVANIS